jgi:hypothetical protein
LSLQFNVGDLAIIQFPYEYEHNGEIVEIVYAPKVGEFLRYSVKYADGGWTSVKPEYLTPIFTI